jgi:hypothetical protein
MLSIDVYRTISEELMLAVGGSSTDGRSLGDNDKIIARALLIITQLGIND